MNLTEYNHSTRFKKLEALYIITWVFIAVIVTLIKLL